MVSNTSSRSTIPDPSLDLTRLVEKLQRTLITPDSETENRVRTSSLERKKVGANLEHARELLIQLEQGAATIRSQARKQETQTSLIQQREVLKDLAERIQELNDLGAHRLEEDDESSEGEDLIGEDTPDDGTETGTEDQEHTPPPTASIASFPPSPTQSEPRTSSYTEPPVIRNRADPKAELFTSASTATGRSTATSEALLTHNRTEQESLSASMLSMAVQLKQQARAFEASLKEDEGMLGKAVDGLERNMTGMGKAQEKMGFLRGYTEGKGWWGRMLMYVWIAGLMLLALVIVFVMPKLRF